MLRLLRQRIGGEEGFALASVIAVFSIVAIVSVTVAAMAVHATGFSTNTRAAVQSRAAADAGINVVFTRLQNDALPLYSRFPCAVSHTYDPTNPSDTPVTYAATVAYYDASGTALSCGTGGTYGFGAGQPAKAVITSKGSAQAQGVAGMSSEDQRTVVAIASITISQTIDNSADLDKAVFTDGSLTVTNASDITDASGLGKANIYSNGDLTCTTSSNNPIQGSVYAQGNVIAYNPCVVNGDIWAGGTYTAPGGNVGIGGNLLIRGGSSAPYQSSSLDTTWVQGSVVSNGGITTSTTGNQQYCSLIGKQARVCGSVVSLTSTVSVGGAAIVGGDVQAYGNVTLAANNGTVVYGNVRSQTGSVSVSGNGSKTSIGGYAAVAGALGVPLKNVGNVPSTCAGSGAAVPKCNPANPPLSLASLPAELNYPTNSLVVAPPRESLPRIGTSASDLSLWTSKGWVVDAVSGCAAATSAMTQSWTGKRLIVVAGCTTRLTLPSLTLPGDLAILAPSGFYDNNGNNAITSSVPGATRTFMAIVPSDALTATGGNLVTWTNPIPSDPNYLSPTCDPTAQAANYGNIALGNNLTMSGDIHTFLYTPCLFTAGNSVGTITGMVYSGTAGTGNGESVAFLSLDVPGALNGSADAGTPVITAVATETARFDARGAS
ncbi:MAG: hypothetical protein EPN48_09105 [Microbacteriaceae bacterium]|nr:MAG: hypothetical protein EPN48_09105 [Microbacteriaceae bacterium]